MNFKTFYPCELTFDNYKVHYMWAKYGSGAIFCFKIDNQINIYAPGNELLLDDSMEPQKFIQPLKILQKTQTF